MRAEVEHEDPTVDAFLKFLALDMGRRPQALTSFSAPLRAYCGSYAGCFC
jgi:hypothetical protein